jgi:phosphatidylglycerophosphatase A
VGGLGFQRFASGTWGSLPPCVAVLVLVAVLPAGFAWVIDAVLAAMLLWAIVGCELWGAKAEEMLGLKDPSCVVLDEIAGMSITLLLLHWPLRSASEGWGWAVTAVLGVAWAFVLFRAFDVIKPPPIRRVDRTVKGGFGVMFDDVIAAFYTVLVFALGTKVFG